MRRCSWILALSSLLCTGLGCGGGGGSAPQPVSWWRAEGNALDSISGNNGTVSGGVTYGPGRSGQAFVFNGVDGQVAIPDADSLKITGSLTIDAWVNVASLPSEQQIWGDILFRGDDRGGLDPYFLAVGWDGNIHFGVDSSDLAVFLDMSAPIALNRWVHVTATLDDRTGRTRIYLDGAVAAETTTTARPFADLCPTCNPGIAIGNSNEPSGFPYAFHGSIDELKVYNAVVPP